MICPYCNSNVLFSETSNHIYGKNYGAVYYCGNFPKCDSYVGCHKHGKLKNKPLGRLANKELRMWKERAHTYFDPLWKFILSLNQNKTQFEVRNNGYKWLSHQLNIHIDECHIGMFDIDNCKKVIELCKPFHKKYSQLKDFK